MKFITEREGGRPPSDLMFTKPLECEVFSGGLRELSRITHQLGKCDLEPKSGFPDATGSHPFALINAFFQKFGLIQCLNLTLKNIIGSQGTIFKGSLNSEFQLTYDELEIPIYVTTSVTWFLSRIN